MRDISWLTAIMMEEDGNMIALEMGFVMEFGVGDGIEILVVVESIKVVLILLKLSEIASLNTCLT